MIFMLICRNLEVRNCMQSIPYWPAIQEAASYSTFYSA